MTDHKSLSCYSLVNHLKEISETNEKYKTLYSIWQIDQQIYSEALKTIITNFPNYSMHDSSHSWSIVNKIEMLLGKDRIVSLSPTDTFMILESAYLHDYGMIVNIDEQKDIMNKPEFKMLVDEIIKNNEDDTLVNAAKSVKNGKPTDEKDSNWMLEAKKNVILIIQEYVRRNHTYRSHDFIFKLEKIDELDYHNTLVPQRLMRLIAEFSFMHGTDFSYVLQNLQRVENGIGTDLIHPRMIACFLRLGDLLDLDNGRFNATLVDNTFMPKSSLIQLKKHQSITHFLVSPNKIEVSAICPDDTVYRATREWIDWLEDEIKNLSCKWSQIVPHNFLGGPPSLGDINISIKNQDKIFKMLNYKFNIEQKVAMEFIEGDGIYKNKFDCIREIIQNALDATRIRLWLDIKSGRYDDYPFDNFKRKDRIISDKYFNFITDIPKEIFKNYYITISLIEVSNESKENNLKSQAYSEYEFSIEDHGCGISSSDLKRIEKVGTSWRGDIDSYKILESMPEWMRPTGSFGIGLHSVFMITNKVEILTKCEGESAYKMILFSSKENGFINVSENNEYKNIGTKVTFRFSKELCQNLNLDDLDEVTRKMIEKHENSLDIVDNVYDKEIQQIRINSIIKGYLGEINNYYIIAKGLLKNDVKLPEVQEYSHYDAKSIDDISIKIKEDKANKNIHAFIWDSSNGAELKFSLLDEKNILANKNIPLLLEAIPLKTDKYCLGKIDVYYKNVFCETVSGQLFHIYLNYVSGEAKELLSVNRNIFREKNMLNEYLCRIKKKIIPLVINELMQYVDNHDLTGEEIGYTNLLLINLYYKEYSNQTKKLTLLSNKFYSGNTYNCIRKITGENDNNPATLRELLEAKAIIVTGNIECGGNVKQTAVKKKITIVLDYLYDLEFNRLRERLHILGFYKINYIDDITYIAYKTNNMDKEYEYLKIDYLDDKSVKNYLRTLYPSQYEDCSKYQQRFVVNAFTYENKDVSNISKLITIDNKIISPFTKSFEQSCLSDKTVCVETVLKSLKQNCKFDDLVTYVLKHNSNSKITVSEIREGYAELINDYINKVIK